MKARIFPFNPNLKTWRNYSNYLNWVDSEINSIKEYSKYWLPSYAILNNPIDGTSVIGSSINQEDGINDISAIKEINGYVIIDPTHLKRKEGIYASSNNYYLWLKGDEPGESNNPGSHPDNFLYIPMSYVVFLKNWTHSGNQQNSAELADANNYFLMSQAFAPIYEIKSIAGGLQYRCYNEGPAVLGSTIGFSLELNPSRYYCLTDDSWQNSAGWSAIGENIISSKGTYWNNSYPIMSNLYSCDGDAYEDFFIDHNITIVMHNIENKNVIEYSINKQDIINDHSILPGVRVVIF